MFLKFISVHFILFHCISVAVNTPLTDVFCSLRFTRFRFLCFVGLLPYVYSQYHSAHNASVIRCLPVPGIARIRIVAW